MKKLLILVISFGLIFCMGCKKQTEEPAQAVKEEVKVETGYADVNGTKLHYEIAGSGTPLVLIHGNFGDMRHWDDQFEVFAENYKVLRYDVRGYGKSSMPVEGESYKSCDDLKALLDFLGIQNAHICGLSMGCGYAVDFVVAYPETSLSLIAIGPWVNGYNPPSAGEMNSSFGEFIAMAKESGAKVAVDHFTSTSFYRHTIRDPEVVNRMREINYDYSFWRFFHEDPELPLDPPASQRLEEINLPTLIVTAEYDLQACKEASDFLYKKIPNAQIIDMPGTGHVMNMEKPDEFNKAVMDFLKKIERM